MTYPIRRRDTTLNVKCSWHAWSSRAKSFVYEDEAVLTARLTPRCVILTWPRGKSDRLRRFDAYGKERSDWRVYFDGTGGVRKFVHIEKVL